MNLEKVKFVRSKTIVTLPTVFTDSLSYLEDIGKLTDKINEIIGQYNVLSAYYNSLDGLLVEMQNKLHELDNEVINFKNKINKEFSTLEEQLVNQISETTSTLQNQFTALKTELQKQQADFEIKINTQVTEAIKSMQETLNNQLEQITLTVEANKVEIYNYLNVELQKFQEQIPEWQNVVVVNPTTGKTEPLQKVINDLYELMRVEAITAGEYDSLNLTAKAYDNFIVNSIPRGLTAYEYDFYGRRLLFVDLNLIMIHPYYGGDVLYKKVTEFNTGLLRESGCFTAFQYDSLQITAENFDSKKMTSQVCDWSINRQFIE